MSAIESSCEILCLIVAVRRFKMFLINKVGLLSLIQEDKIHFTSSADFWILRTLFFFLLE